MKIREGFVSNSSSSSFVLFTSKKNFDEVMSKAHPYVQAVVHAMGPIYKRFLGTDVVGLHEWDSHGDGKIAYLQVNYDDDIPEELEDTYEVWEQFTFDLKNAGEDAVLTHYADM